MKKLNATEVLGVHTALYNFLCENILDIVKAQEMPSDTQGGLVRDYGILGKDLRLKPPEYPVLQKSKFQLNDFNKFMPIPLEICCL